MILKKLISFFSLSILIITLFGCQTIQKEESPEKRKKEILDTQKSLIVSFLNKSMPHLALKELRVLIRKSPRDADLLNLMGLTQLSLNNARVAVKYFNRSYKASPSISVALNLSSSYINLKEYSKAIKLLKTVKKSKSFENYQYPERINHNLGLAYEKSRKNGLAKKYYKSALKFNPVYYLTLMRVGELFRKTGKIKTSMKYFYKAKSSCGVCYDPIKAISHNYVALGQGSKAIPLVKSFLKTKDLSPTNRQKASKLLKYTKRSRKNRRIVKRKKNIYRR